MSPPQLTVYFEDANLIVLEKPAGLLSQGEHSGDPNLVDLLRVRFGRPYVGLVHRLDRNTSGIMVVAKRTKAAQRLTAALQTGLLKRQYLAWLHGNITQGGTWTHNLLKDEESNTVRALSAPAAGSKEATLSYLPRARGEWHGQVLTLVEFTLATGRSHQIRVQAAAEGSPVLGDSKYGDTTQALRSDAPPSSARLALHSFRITFPHPIGGTEHCYESPLPEDMSQMLMAKSFKIQHS